MTHLARHRGAKCRIRSRQWGDLSIESIQLTEAVDGDLMVFFGDPLGVDRPVVRIHSECVFAEVLDSTLCDCADQLDLALRRLTSSGSGILFYLRIDGRGAGLAAKVAATDLEVAGMDTWESRLAIGVDPDGRSFTGVAELLKGRGILEVTLLTNNPRKADDLIAAGVDVDLEGLVVEGVSDEVRRLYRTKAERFGHQIPPAVR